MLVSELNEIRSRANLELRTEAQKQALYHEARRAMEREQGAYNSFSGADKAEAPVWASVRDFYHAVAEGMPIDDALAFADEKWRSYAVEAQRKVAEAPKVQRGPSSGHSVISHRWVSLEFFRSKEPHLRAMCARLTRN